MSITFKLNGEERAYDGAPMARLLDVLRRDFALTGTKEGCGEGECGACTVLLDGEPVCACLVPIFQCGGREVVSVEGIAKGGELSAVQQRFVNAGGVQCGACTPGMIVTTHALIAHRERPDRETIRDYLAGTLCRCTGYERILQAVEHAVSDAHAGAETERDGA